MSKLDYPRRKASLFKPKPLPSGIGRLTPVVRKSPAAKEVQAKAIQHRKAIVSHRKRKKA